MGHVESNAVTGTPRLGLLLHTLREQPTGRPLRRLHLQTACGSRLFSRIGILQPTSKPRQETAGKCCPPGRNVGADGPYHDQHSPQIRGPLPHASMENGDEVGASTTEHIQAPSA